MLGCWLLAGCIPCNGACAAEPTVIEKLIAAHCLDCHSSDQPEGGLALDQVAWNDDREFSASEDRQPVSAEVLEAVAKKLRTRQMPPAGSSRPTDSEYAKAIAWLESQADAYSTQHPNPGRTDSLRRMNRTEYQNAIRDLLALDIDAQALLPTDEASHGFDNLTLGDLSPTLLNRYVSAAEKISRMALGVAGNSPGGDTIRIKPDLTQDGRIAELPLGSRGGALLHYTFPRTGEYEIELRLTRDRNEHVEGLSREHIVEILIDRRLAADFKIKPAKGQDHSQVDQHLKTRLSVVGGPHDLGVTFVHNSSALMETMRQPLESRFNEHRHPRQSPALYQVSITGPFTSHATEDTPSRQRVLSCRPNSPVEEQDCARSIIADLTRRAFRRTSKPEDLAGPMRFYEEARLAGGDFQAGIEAALSAILVSPQFLFRIEVEPEGLTSGDVYQISQFELASRLSYFLWSSLPDEELLLVAEQGRLRDPIMLEAQVRRMLQDQRASTNLVSNFAAQWLYLRNLDATSPDARLFPDFDDNLRQAMRTETELLFEEIMRDDQSVLGLLSTDHTYLNERLAKHYEIPYVYGPHFRRVELPESSRRGGLLRQASILTITSYATRTSPVIRGHWILENLLGAALPPPPPNVPVLDNTVSADLPMRQRLAVHRENAACAGCHNLMDPVGFALENFDAIGRWRDSELGQPVDATGAMAGGAEFAGVDGLEQALLHNEEMFVSTLSEKLLTFAIGRGIEHYDAPVIRKIVRDAKTQDYRFSSVVMGIVSSTAFQMRTAK